ncbi:uncharacterized protein LOC111576027 isoform X1 [Amphiprion ocellaris]|uniref:uncharacterized protein LOC111576027 isoform X1 n=1 Tax=Amphiprion ocellaris TaxID=80972 RepID=UPI002410F168|nr:uncharacterized protein LOC111576027 isoform X1 [Amphiprion ocellaris]XP_035809350.2 uncharacterized protein LOC111576027 isoform X1 [Amphiprion ocellaris]XP_054867579.1 uncharacterized protein LOC111576027 isoform X1 [Amphiprion ocellaris]XP_054867580.1 uncharacterized protein LOC111576027 isoform X1 [Amphiprion ocellaris]
MAGQYFVIQKASSTMISNMIELTFIFLLWFVPELALCSPVTAGVNGTVQMLYCEGCAPNVTKVFCNDENLLGHSHIPNCSGPPQPNSVCQQDGSVFVSTSTSSDCQFEGENYIETKPCPDLSCFVHGPTSSSKLGPFDPKEAPEDHTKPIVLGVADQVLLLVLAVVAVVAVVLVAYFCKKGRTRQSNLEQQSDPGETDALKMEQRPGDIERAPPAVPGLDDDTSPSQCDSGV